MAYIPDEWVMGNLEIAPSAVRLLFYYCGRADQDKGRTNVSAQRASQDLGIRKDHIDEHDRKLVKTELIRIVRDENGGRVIQMLAPWQSRAQRTGKPATSQDLGSSLVGPPNLGEIPQNLGESSQVLGEVTQNLGESTQNLGLHIRNNQLMNQPIEPAHEPASCASAPPGGGISKPGGKKPSGKKTIPPKSQFHNHPGVTAYREILGFYALNAAQADLIAEAIGEQAEVAPPEWLKFLRELAETGNKYAYNVRLMVVAFMRYRANASLTEALNLAWDEAKGRNNGKPDKHKTVPGKTTADYGIRDCPVLGE